MEIHKLKGNRIEDIRKKFHLSALCAKVLACKDIDDDEIAELLKEPELMNPFDANGMDVLIQRLYDAKLNKEKVLVCGDYDADGICSTAILVDALKIFGIPCGFYIPNRFKEGYGLNVSTVQSAKEKGYTLLITVDNGVKAFDALEYAKKLKIDVIVTDHHTMDEEVDCYCLLHPQFMGEEFSTLSGAGVALEISRALIGEKKEHVVLACVAIIADVMPLRKEARAIVRLGIQYLKQGYCVPIQMLANDRYPKWDEILIAFQIVPKLNVTGRLADMVNVNNTVRYLLLTSAEQIQFVAMQITKLNEKRKQMSNEMLEKARSLIHNEYNFQLLFDDSFHEGIVGLVAGKLAEEYHMPIMVATKSKDGFKGSIRSQGLLDLTTFFDECKNELDSYGGHKAAAGIGFCFDKKQFIQDYVNNKMENVVFETNEKYDVIDVTLEDLNISEIESLSLLAPFGEGFQEPLFIIENQKVQACKALSNGAHTKWIINDELEAMQFNSTAFKSFDENKKYSFIGNLRINNFKGRKKMNIFVTEIF